MIASEIDFDLPGKHTGFLRLAHSTHQSAYGWIPIPAASVRGGEGPCVLVMAGSHGDEYEGQLLVAELVRELQPESVDGQLILLPMANFPAAQAGLRTSPIDGGNLNRSFPGDARGSVTERIADYLEHQLMKRCSLVVDLHSGGSSLLYDGAVLMALQPRDAQEEERLLGEIAAFGLPRALLHAPANPATILSAARRQGTACLMAELGGGGMVTPRILREARAGLRRLLAHLGVLREPGAAATQASTTTRILRVDPAAHHVYAREDGVFEPLVELGDSVQPGQPVARLHFPASPWREPETVRALGAGEIVCQRVPALSRRGDCLFQLASG